MKRILSIMLLLAIICFSVAGCGQTDNTISDSSGNENSIAQNTELPSTRMQDNTNTENPKDTVTSDNNVTGSETTTGNPTNTSLATSTPTGSQSISPAHIHTLQHYNPVAANCTENGMAEYWNCSKCGKNYSDQNGSTEIKSTIISAKGHNEVTDNSVSATCTSTGLTTGKHCSVCGKVLTAQSSTQMLNHASSSWIIDKQATEKTEGSRHTECTVCKKVLKTESIEKLKPQNLSTKTYTLNGVSFKMILVEGGTFTMGSNSRESNQAPEHQVTLSSYLMGETEVTQALWNTVMGLGGGSNEYPIASVTKPQCDTFAKKLSEMAHAAGKFLMT